MDNLRSVIETLFVHAQGNDVLEKLYSTSSSTRLDVSVDKKFFLHYLFHQNKAYTFDQYENLFHLLSTKWMSYPKLREKSIFNVLNYFNEQVLTLVSNVPTVKYEHLLRWHELSVRVGEDLLTTSYLALQDCLNGVERNDFCWDLSISQDNKVLNGLLNKPLCELHNHMKGSSCNFELNWLSLMNHIDKRKKEFDDVLFQFTQAPDLLLRRNSHFNSMYACAVKAAVIRAILFSYLKGVTFELGENRDGIHDALLSKTDIELSYYASILQHESLDVFLILFGMPYLADDGKIERVDYAIHSDTTCRGHYYEEDFNYFNTIFSGERWLMYSVLKQIYAGIIPTGYSTLFYAYILLKSRVRYELVQLNQGLGFENFNQYEKRKLQFVPDGSVYDKLVAKFSVDSVTNNGNSDNYIETRIVPKISSRECIEQLCGLDKQIKSEEFGPHRGKDNYKFIYHFIKTKDTKSDKSPFLPRQHFLRKKVMKQAKAIYEMRRAFNPVVQEIVGVDAANSEIFARPEVFAHAFRFLRKQKLNTNHFFRQLPDLGMTYHV